MNTLSEQGRQTVRQIAAAQNFSPECVEHVLNAMAHSGGRAVQFNHPELGGMGQWMPGMVMIGDMFNNGLKGRVDQLCTQLSQALATQPGMYRSSADATRGTRSAESLASGNWWPAELGVPSSVGSQNNARYAYFPQARRLAVDMGGSVTLYDTLDHRIGGVSQQQGGEQTITFTSQSGTIDLRQLPRVG